MQIKYMQLDLTNKEKSINTLKCFQSKEYFIIGVEVTDIECGNTCHINIDPQHGFATNNNITSVELIYKQIEKLKNMCSLFKNILFVTVKPDLDSISAMVLATFYLKEPNFKLTNNDMMLRLITIANSDRHGGEQWKSHNRENYFKERHLFSKFGLPVGILAAVGDVKKDISTKVHYVSTYLKTGTFDKIKEYTEIVSNKNKMNSQFTTVEVLIPTKLVFVESNYRGALGLGYNQAPIVIAKNPTFVFNKTTKGTKYTIAQFNSGHINLELVMNRLNEIESGWGGDIKSILGSPQTAPSIIEKHRIIEIVKDALGDSS